ncbi:MAG: tRNA (adenosine(37)-N6)-threonylcarbamoyltransferase complex dimerization subunit type 1 TsaB [Candidatus Saccharimonadales bacterium]
MILTIRTDNPQAEVGLYQGDQKVAYKTWQAHRELSATIHKVIDELLDDKKLTLDDLTGIVFYKGPGSFTGLRIGAAVANALASVNHTPITQSDGENWVQVGLKMLEKKEFIMAQPNYGAEAFVTKPKK